MRLAGQPAPRRAAATRGQIQATAPAQSQTPAPGQPPAPPKPKAKIPLDELESIRFERTPGLAARFIGQPNLDFTMPNRGEVKNDATKKPDAKKAAAGDDVLAPPPGTTVTKIPKVEPKKNGIRDLYLSALRF